MEMSASVRWQVTLFDMSEQALAWLGEMTGIERQPGSNAARVFLEVFSPVVACE